MKRHINHLFLCLLIWLGGVVSLGAAGWDVSSETIFQSVQRDTFEGSDKQVVPLYEYMRVDYGDNESGGLAFHSYGWIRKDLLKSGYYEDDPDGELLYAYLSYAKPYSCFKINLGRQHIFAGVSNESVDGLRLDLGLGNYLSLSGYGGVPVDMEETDGRSKDIIYGGRVGLTVPAAAGLGVSYKRVEDNGATQEHTAGMDFYWVPSTYLYWDGRSALNLETQGWREHNYNIRITFGPFEFSPLYQRFIYKDYFGTAENRKNLFRFLLNSEEALTIWGAKATWYGSKYLEITGNGRRYEYEFRETGANFFSSALALNFRDGLSFGLEAGLMDGQIPEDTYQLYRAFCFWSPSSALGPSGQVSADIIYQGFDETIYNKDSALFASLGVGRGFLNDKMQINASVNYSQDPFFENDISTILTILFKL